MLIDWDKERTTMASKKFAPQPIPPFSTEKPHKEEKPVKVKRAHHPPQANLNMQRTSSDEDEKGKQHNDIVTAYQTSFSR